MSKKAIQSIIFLMSISLVGLVAFQAYWISYTIEREVESFDRNMQQVLYTIAEEVLKEEAKILVDKASTRTKSTFIKGSAVNDIKVIIKDATEVDLDKYKNKTIVVDTDNGKTTITTTTRIGNMSSTVVTDGIVERYESQKNILTEVVEDMAFQFAVSDVNLADRLKSISLDTLIESVLINSGFKSIEYSYQLKDLSSDSIVKTGGELISDASLAHYITSLSDDGELNFGVQNKQLLVLKSLWLTLTLSFILTAILIGTFIYTIQSILRQKRISTMKADFINNMTHEFKTPVATISLAIDSILHKEIKDKPEEIEKFGSIIKKENARMNNQIESLLSIALFDKKSFELNHETVDVHQLLHELKENFEMKTSKQSGDFALFLNAKKTEIIADKMHFYNVLRNIIDNGIKFSKEAFRIKVATESTDNYLNITISDQGIGMSKDTQSKIFTRFYRKTEGDIHTTKGFGLGLTYVKEVIDKMGATINVKSELNKGTAFMITIPINQ